MRILKFTTLSLIVALYGCGGSDSPPQSEQPSSKIGIFLDSPISNIGYRTKTKEGVTNAKGEYEYMLGETVTFFIGDLIFPPVTAAEVVTPLNIADTQDINNPVVVNMIRLLQTLDKNGDPDDGIEITEIAKDNATIVNFELEIAEFEASSAVTVLVNNGGQDSGGMPLISVADAIANFEEGLIDNGLSFGSIEGVWELPGESVIFMYLPDDRYFAIQWEEENNFIGFERGTYTTNGAEVSFSTLQNNDGEALVCSEPSGGTCSNEVFGLSISGSELTLNPPGENSVLFDRQSFSNGSIEGIWELPGESVIFMYFPDDRYFAIQWQEENNFIGFERGTYTVNGTDVSFSTLQNNDGEALVCGEPSGSTCSNEVFGFSISGSELTLNPTGEDSAVFDRLF